MHFPDSRSRIDNRESKVGNSLEVACWAKIVNAIAGIIIPAPDGD
jgi:hypothetical protein